MDRYTKLLDDETISVTERSKILDKIADLQEKQNYFKQILVNLCTSKTFYGIVALMTIHQHESLLKGCVNLVIGGIKAWRDLENTRGWWDNVSSFMSTILPSGIAIFRLWLGF